MIRLEFENQSTRLIKYFCMYILTVAACLSFSTVAMAKVLIREVNLRSMHFDRNVLWAEVIGEMSSRCDELVDVEFVLSPTMTTNQELAIYTEETASDEDPVRCDPLPKKFVKRVDLGVIDPGQYRLRILDNGATIFSKKLSVPFDVKPQPLGFEFENSIGQMSPMILHEKS